MGDLVSTVYTLLPVGGDDKSLPSLDIAEEGMKYEITCWPELSEYTEYVEFDGLTADQVIAVAVKMLNIVLYQYPEKMPEIVDKLRQLKY